MAEEEMHFKDVLREDQRVEDYKKIRFTDPATPWLK